MRGKKRKANATPISSTGQDVFGSHETARMLQPQDDGDDDLWPTRLQLSSAGPSQDKRTRRQVYKVTKCAPCGRPVEMCMRWAQESTSKTGKRTLEAPGCKDCFDLFVDGDYTLRTDIKVGNFDEFCALTETSELFHNEVRTSIKVRQKAERRQFHDEECCLLVMSGWRSEEHYIGIKAKDFERHFGSTISESGFKVQDLPTGGNATYKGIMTQIDCYGLVFAEGFHVFQNS
jgi:hypothetical protein